MSGDDRITHRITHAVFVKWYAVTPSDFGCSRCSRKAEFVRSKLSKRPSGETIQATGFCRQHALKAGCPEAEKIQEFRSKRHFYSLLFI